MTDANPRLPRTIVAIKNQMAAGLHVGAQLYVSQRGQVVADVAVGLSRDGVPMRTDTLMLWLSSGKPITAVAIAQLWEQGRLELDDPVAMHIPEFAVGGKDAITIRHVLMHTCGFRAVLGHWEDQPWEQVIAALCTARVEPGWIVGETAGYHALTSWYILGEIVRRLDGRPFDQYVREAIFTPIGMKDCWLGMPLERQREYGDRFGLMHDTRTGTPMANYPLDTPRIAAQCRPPSGARGPIRELGKFYEAMLAAFLPLPSGEGGGAGEQGPVHVRPHPLPKGEGRRVGVLRDQTIEAITTHHRVGIYDKTFKHVVDWGLGFIMQSNQYGIDTVPYGFGPHASRRTFGHSGSRSSTGYADPEHGLVVACVFNGAPDEAKHDQRMREVNAAIYEDLGLASTDKNPSGPSSSSVIPSPP